jgi:hypothetical protein
MHASSAFNTESIMLLSAQHTTLNLPRNGTGRLSRASAARLHVVDGVAWVTIDGDRRDIVLERGASFDVDSDGDVIVFALGGPAAVEVHAPAGAV